MSEEVDFLIDRIRTEYGAGSLPAGSGAAGEEPPLAIVDRADVETEDGTRERVGDLATANYVSIASVDEATEPIGTEYDHALEHVAGLRIEGVHHTEWGHVDADGQEGAPWPSLKRVIRRGVLRARTFPDPGTPNIDYTDLRLANQSDQSQNYADYYRYDADIIFDGYEELP